MWIGIGNSFFRRGGGFTFKPADAPTGLALTVISDTEIKLDWTVNATAHDGHRIYYSTDGTTFTEKGTVSGSTATYNATGLTTNTRYYFKVVAYKSSVESNATSTQNDWTAMKIVLTSTGTGAGVATIRFWFDTVNTVATLDGNGRFYSDAGGTADESTSYTFTYGSLQTRYLKVTSGTSNLLVFHKNNMRGWGSNSLDGWVSSTNAPSASITLANLARSLIYFYCRGFNTVSGNLSGLPSGLTYFNCYGSNTVSGNLSGLPSGLIYFICQGSNTVSGNLSGLPSGLTYFLCYGSNTVSGNLSGLPSGLTYFNCYGSNTVSGNLSGLPSGLIYFYCHGFNTISGNLSGLPSGLTYFLCDGSNTVSGDLSGLPSGLIYFLCQGSNTIADYTAGRTWSNSVNYIYLKQATGNGFSSTEVDNLLIDLANATWAESSRRVELPSPNSSRTSASDTAVATLVSKSVTVVTA